MESSWKKPESRMQKPAAPLSTMESQDAREEREIAEGVSKAAKAKEDARDKIGEKIGGAYFVTDWTDPILYNKTLGRQMTVSRFYPTINVAIDVFPHVGEWERMIIELKREIFKDGMATFAGQPVKVRYASLSYADQLAELLRQLEE